MRSRKRNVYEVRRAAELVVWERKRCEECGGREGATRARRERGGGAMVGTERGCRVFV